MRSGPVAMHGVLLLTLVLAGCGRPPKCDSPGPAEPVAGAEPDAGVLSSASDPSATKLLRFDAAFRRRFDSETRDSAWADAREAKIRRLVNALSGVEVSAVACHETICEIRLAFDSAAAMSSFSERLLLEASDLFPPNGVGHLMFSEPKSNTARMWMTREGFSNPGPNGERGTYTPPGPVDPEDPGSPADAGAGE